MQSEQQEVKKPFRQFFYRGKEVETLVDTPREELMELLHARARRRFKRGNNLDAYEHFLARLRKAKARAAGGRPDFVKTHLRNAIVLPEMVGSNVGIYNGFGFHPVEIKVRPTFHVHP